VDCYLCHQEDLAEGNIYPKLTRIRDISAKIATKVIEQAFEEVRENLRALNLQELATIQRPQNIEEFVRAAMWSPKYD
jgi:malate dehydrogenase (oxaloacetate-decarboxylating)(NADP+)